ncbi:MAG TPA: 50S ribosomal protein L6 [Candidatus Saccharibacteria bacterium]|nr:50S ribosomal protein L6 [Candidatus Saccharibacteria bacterium]
MSRIGRLPITMPSNVTLSVDNDVIKVTGPKGELSEQILSGVKIIQEENLITVQRLSDSKIDKSNHGLMRSLINNMVVGVTEGFKKELEVTGVGFRVAVSGNMLKLKVGFSHDIEYKFPDGINVSVEQNKITVEGISKQQVGQTAAEIRSFKKPEPYKGKGISYVGERILRKSGKSGKE